MALQFVVFGFTICENYCLAWLKCLSLHQSNLIKTITLMKKILLFAAAFLFNIGIQAQTDVTSQYIPNAGFEECDAIETTVVHDNQNEVDVTVAPLFTPERVAKCIDYTNEGWQLVATSTSACGAVIGYGTNVQYSKWYAIGDPGPGQGITGEKGLCFSGNMGLVYQQANEITLPAGSYRLTVNLYARNGQTSNPSATQQVVNIKTGFMPTGGTEDDLIPGVRSSVQFTSNAWDQDVLDIELTEATTGRFQLSYGSSYFVVVDDVKLEFFGSVVTTNLSNAIEKATALNAELNNNDLSAAIETAQALLNDPTDQESVDAQTETLYAAMGTALAATTVPVNITAAYLENPSFEAGLAPWNWVSASGNVGEPLNAESVPYIDGNNILEFVTSGTNGVTQTISHLPAGYYIIDAKLNQKAFLKMGSGTGTLVQGGSDALFLRVHPSAYNLEADGKLTIGAQASVSYRIDNFRLFYGKDEASLLEVLLQDVKADAQAIVGMTKFDIVTGEERTNLLTAIEGSDIDAINTALDAFVSAFEAYNKLEKAKETAAAYNEEAYPYAKKEILEQIQELIAKQPSSAANATEMKEQLETAIFDVYVSNAYCEGVTNAKDYTENIVAGNATGTAVATAWHKLNMEIRTDKTAWTNPKTNEADKNVYGVTADYYRTSNEKNSYMWQTISGLPKGKYVLSVTYMSPATVSAEVLVNDEKVGSLTGVGMYGGGVYGGGWVENVITFNKADDQDMNLKLQYTGTANYQDWYFDNLRLYCIDAEQPQDEEHEYGIVGDFSDWDTDLMMTQAEDGTYTLSITDLEVREPKTFEYKLRADQQWGVYELPAPGSDPQNFSWTPEMSGFYTLNFVFNLEENSLTLDAERTDDCTWTATYVNVADWAEVWAYTWTDENMQMGEWPGTQLTATEEQVDGHSVYAFSYKGEAAPAFIIFNNGQGGDTNQTNDLEFVDGKQYTDGPKQVIPTAIEQCVEMLPQQAYDLQGRRVNEGQNKKGIYIVNGKKIVIK